MCSSYVPDKIYHLVVLMVTTLGDADYPYVSLVLVACNSFEENDRKLVHEFRSPC